MTVTPVEREPGEDTITATIDADTFKEEVTSSSTITLTYTTNWSESPATYGITVTGTPKNGDVITVVYVKENRGTITQSTPTKYIATGWNLYNHTEGYARAIHYSDSYGFCIEGTYTAVKFSTTLEGTKSTITPVDGYFNIANNGYIWVEGGNSTDTEVYMTWSDWIDTTDHPSYQAYTEHEINLTTIMNTYFSHGLMRVGDVRDEIDLNVGLAISNVERLSYSAENLATAQASGRVYECDTNYIYLARASAVTSEITLDGEYTANDHGIEYFTDSTVPVYAIVLYGNNMKNKLERDVLTKSTDLVDNLTTNDGTKALSAKQGKLLNDQIETLYASDTFTVTRSNTTTSGSTHTGIKLGKLRIISMDFTTNATGSGWVTIATTTTTPKYSVYGNATATDGSTRLCRIETNGNLQCYSPVGDKNYMGQIVYAS